MTQANKRIRIALDAMGGDYAPAEIVKGAILAAQDGDVDVILAGPMKVLEKELAKYDSAALPVRCVEASDVIHEGEAPALAVRRKPNCSVSVATRLVKSGEADAVISAGSSGATTVSAMYYLGMLEGMERPAIGGTLGSFAPNVVWMDLGANVDCKPYQLLAFAIAGS
ncbi:MAG: phosphate--acyl-ACP acyltransferase, partial [Chloroflexota bacterium]|nr:phosphate--acyl-ACP acyltransferase [Chloroflexota bacterium]